MILFMTFDYSEGRVRRARLILFMTFDHSEGPKGLSNIIYDL